MKRTIPCDDCPASEACWNYAKGPDPRNPTGPWIIVGWFDCHKEEENEVSSSDPTQLR